MTVSSSLVVPVVLWGRSAPTHCISAVLMTQDLKSIITGCNDGQICLWDVTDNWQVYPRSMLFGHTAAISCLAKGSDHDDRPYIVSSSENGEMCLWDISDGRCIENTKMPVVHTNIQSYRFKNCRDLRLMCNGYYPEIHIIDPFTFEIIYSLCSKVAPDWISACCVIRPMKKEDDVVVAVSNSGAVKVWSLAGNETKSRPVYEDESKQIRCLNAQTLRCCQYNQRTVLIVCSKYWQVYYYDVREGLSNHDSAAIYDAGDFSLLCSEANRCGERWAGGDFVSIDRVIVWSNEGKGYLYKLPTNAHSSSNHTQSGSSAIPDSDDYHRHGHQPSAPHAYYILDMYTDQSVSCSPAMQFHIGGTMEKRSKLLLRGDSEGQVVIWALPEVSEKQMTLVRQESFDRLPALSPRSSTTLQDIWDGLYQPPSGVIDKLCDVNDIPLQVTATIYIPSQGKLVCGREDGTIIIVHGTQSIIIQLLEKRSHAPDNIPLQILQGHDGKVTCLLYPFNESTRYEPRHLVSAGIDFSVCLWDIYSGTKMHTFTVHGGEITQLLVPPNNCNPRILSSICSVASDHSVTLLSLKERKCIMLAGRHLYPVQCIRWRPLDDFMVVSCTDGTIYVWQMETGHLDRVVHGITAEEILNNCDENATPMATLTNPSITLAQAFKRRNLATFRNLAQQKLQVPQAHNQQSQAAKSEFMKPQGYPLLIQGVRTNTKDPDAHVLFFDIESLIVQLLTEEYATMSPGELEAMGIITPIMERTIHSQHSELNDAQAKLAGFIAKVKDTAENVGQKIQARVDSSGFLPVPNATVGSAVRDTKSSPELGARSKPAARPDSVPLVSNSLTLDIAQLLMSCIHAWGLDPELDKLCIGKLGLLKPRCPISFGLLSRQGHMSLMLPGWHKRVCKEEISLVKPVRTTRHAPTLMQQARSVSFEDLEQALNIPKPPHRTGGMQEELGFGGASTLADEHPAAAMSARERDMQEETRIFSTRARWQISSAVTTQHILSIISVANTLMSMNHATFIQGRQKKAKRHPPTHVMSETFDGGSTGSDDESADLMMLQQAQIKQGWSLLAAMHCVLIPDLVGNGNFKHCQLEMLARRWQDRCLEIREAGQAALLAELRRIGPEGRKTVVDDWSPFLPTYTEPSASLLAEGLLMRGDEDEDEDDDPMLCSDSPVHKVTSNFESRRRQATAIVMLGVIGAEFGHEMEPSKRKGDDPKKKKNAQDGFGLTNYSLARQTSKALTFLLLQPPSARLPAFTPIRRAAIDLLGRGFTVWEPYLDVSSVLLGLLELCVDAERLIPSMTFGLPLTPVADACRTSRHALSLIATARSPAFIITIAKEVARYNAMVQSAQSQHTQIHQSVLVRARFEIMRVIELLVDKMPSDVAEQLVDVMDVTVHCLDNAQLKSKGLLELFPAICRFSMVSHCANTKRIWVGAKNGGLAFYDLKQHSKCQMIPAHSGAVIAVSVSPEGKYLVSYSHHDSKLKFWQTASSSLFSIGSQQTKCVKMISTPPCHVPPHTNILKLVRLIWIDNRTVILLTINGTETKYTI